MGGRLMKRQRLSRFMFLLSGLMFTASLSGCFFFQSKNTKSGSKQGAGSGVLGASLGDRAGVEDAEALASLHGLATTHAPAGVRPDPDLTVRQLLLQYRESGSTVAREIGRVEQYRMLLGGANVTFTVAPQEGYDSTSLLAELKVAEEVCRSLVSPSADDHPGWGTILPAAASDTETTLLFLAQRILGVPSDRVDPASITALKGIIDTAKVSGQITEASYIPACATLVLDAEGLLL